MVAPPFLLWAWLVFVGFVLALLFLDLFVLHRDARKVPFREALWLSVLWIAVSLAFGGFVSIPPSPERSR
jgi:tellurite resistance protein TerC